MNIIEELTWRGLLQDCTDKDGICKLTNSDSFYVGYDPTAPSLQIGNLIPVLVSVRIARSGIRALQLFGGATGAIGDPSGRNQERQLLTREVIESNVSNHKRIVSAIFERAGVKATFVDNYEWTKNINVIEFLREVGKYFTVNYMIAKEVVKTRLDGEGISFTEFSYMLLQANDYLHLYQKEHCRLQIGGSDQWGNITAGLELIRKRGLCDAYALSFPLLTDSQGRKFGKSEGGTIWLDSAATSPYRFHQFWLNIEDADLERYLKVFSFKTKEEIEHLLAEAKRNPEQRSAQKALADEVCTLVHGAQATELAKRSAEVLFGGSLSGLTSAQLKEIFADVPASELSSNDLENKSIADVFVHSGLVKSKGEAKRLLAAGGAYINNERVSDPEQKAIQACLQNNEFVVLRSGKKSYHLIRILK